MKLKRDISSTSAPAPDQIEIGELLINAKTGILYSKRVDGTVVKWVSSQLCDTSNGNLMSAVPVISVSDTSAICCNGSAITVVVNNLIYENRYRLTITDLNPTAGVIVGDYNTELLPITSSQRSILINIDIPNENKNAILKFSVSQIVSINSADVDILKSESIISTTCQNC
jgi:hypothetical protein